MNLRTVLLVAGLLVGAAVGWFTAPEPAVDIRAGGLSVTVGGGDGSGGTMTVTGKDGGLQVQVGERGPLDEPGPRAVIFAVIGAAVGFGAGYLLDTRKG